MKLLPRSLSSRLALIVSLLFTLTVFVFTWCTAEQQSDFAESILEAQTQALAKGVAGASALAGAKEMIAGLAGAVKRLAEALAGQMAQA